MGIFRRLGLVTVATLALAAPAAAQISLELREGAPGANQLVLRFETDAALPGPFHLLKRWVPMEELVSEALPLDPVADLYIPDIPRIGALPRSLEIDGAAGIRVYQVVNDAGACSNLAYVIKHSGGGSSEWLPPLVFAQPWRGGARTVSELFERHPSLRGVRLVGPGLRLEEAYLLVVRRQDGSLSGPDWLVPPGAAVLADWSDDSDVIVVGAAEPSPRPFPAGGYRTGTLALSVLSPRLGQPRMNLAEIACGRAGIAWPDPDGDRIPEDECPGPLSVELPGTRFGGANYTHVASHERGVGFIGSSVLLFGSNLTWLGSASWDPSPALGLLLNTNKNPGEPDYATRTWLPDDLGAAPGCTCPDSDGDGVDDCSERLRGADSLDPADGEPDFDGDGVPDHDDLCQLVFDPAQLDSDLDGLGDACDPCPSGDPACEDPDGDGRLIWFDNCPDTPNPEQFDEDNDGLGDACDACPTVFEPDGLLPDDDGDGTPSACDTCPAVFDPGQEDRDGDGVGDACDNCIEDRNPRQTDTDGDSIGNDCDCDLFDAGSWGRPSFLRGLRLSVAPEIMGVRPVTLLWDDLSAELGPGRLHDIAGGPLDSLRQLGHTGGGSCLVDDHPAADWTTVEAGSTWYLVRVENSCGEGTWEVPGHGSIRDNRQPCP